MLSLYYFKLPELQPHFSWPALCHISDTGRSKPLALLCTEAAPGAERPPCPFGWHIPSCISVPQDTGKRSGNYGGSAPPRRALTFPRHVEGRKSCPSPNLSLPEL